MGKRPTVPEVFIIESLRLKDEEAGRHEGKILSRMLTLAGKQTKYFYIRTERELDKIVDRFYDSDYRHLHISCHANGEEMATTFDPIPYKELTDMLAPCLENRRVFVSACQMANDTLAGGLLKNTGCRSLIGPARAIRFDDAAALWVAFYQLMFRKNEKAMKHAEMDYYVNELARLFEEPMNYFRADDTRACGFRRVHKTGASRLTAA